MKNFSRQGVCVSFALEDGENGSKKVPVVFGAAGDGELMK